MTKRSPVEFKNKQRELKLTEWKIGQCNSCRYKTRFIFKGNQPAYDNGCHCKWINISTITYDIIANYYNSLDPSSSCYTEAKDFWHF